MKKSKIWKVALNPGKKKASVQTRYQNALAYAKEMTGNPNFPTPSPALAVIAAAANDVQTAYTAALNKTRGLVKVMHEKDAALQLLLLKLAAYVEGIANGTPAQAESIILSAGMAVKKSGIRAPRSLSVASEVKGEVTLTTVTQRNSSYRWEVATGDPTMEANWKLLVEVRQSKTIFKGLTSGTNYHFRVWPIGSTGVGVVSQVVSTVVL